VRSDAGVRYTRNGQFTTGQGGLLVDQLGNPVLSQNGQTISVASDGAVDPGRLGVFAVNNPTKVGDGNFTGQANGQATGSAQSGVLEGSGTNPATAMVEMISSLRSFEAGQKAIQTIDETLQKASTQVGSIS
jgi:flagellar basal-body rod protein FlgF